MPEKVTDLISAAITKRDKGVDWEREVKEQVTADCEACTAKLAAISEGVGDAPEKVFDPSQLEKDLKAGKVDQYARRGNTVRVCVNGDWEQGIVKEAK